MFKWFKNLFKSDFDGVEEKLLKTFNFLINDYNFSYSKTNLGNLTDEDGNFIFYGPYNAYQFYNESVCINILHLVQRGEYDVYITDRKSCDQIYIREGTKIPDNFPLLADKVKESIPNGELFGHKIKI